MSLVGVSEPSLRAVEEYYIAYFGRPGDVPGATFWGSAVDAAGGPTTTAGKAVLANIAKDFAGSPEYTTFKAGKTNQQIVEAIYTNVLHRTGDASGVAFWTAALNADPTLVDKIVIEILTAAKGNAGTDDQQTINNLIDITSKFTSELSLSPADSAQYIADNFKQGFGLVKSTDHDGGPTYNIAHTGEVTATGTIKDDHIIGFDFNDQIIGLSGNDTLEGLGGDDRINGNSGDDTINGGDGNDTIFGDDGKDDINGDGGNDTVDGGTGDDHIDGGAGDDSLMGGAGNDVITGNTGKDTINGNDGNDTIAGGSEDDTLNGDLGSDTISGDAGNDVIDGGLNVAYIAAVPGDINKGIAAIAEKVGTHDTLVGGNGNDDFLFQTKTDGSTTGSSYVSAVAKHETETIDQIVDLNFGGTSTNDVVDQLGLVGKALVSGAAYLSSDIGATANISTDAAGLVAAIAGATTGSIGIVNVTGGALSGKSYFYEAVAADAFAQATDTLIEITGFTGTFDLSDVFV